MTDPAAAATDHPQAPAPARARWLKWPLIALVSAAVAAAIWQQLPGAAYPTDLSVIGSGRPTLVLAQDGSYVSGTEVMALMNHIRHDYAGQVDFLVAHLPRPDAVAFSARHGARDGTVLLFDGKGRLVNTLESPRSQDELRRALSQAFGVEAGAAPK